ncbi:MAG TPA: glycosyltransferase [Thermodesulfovibrionales bacterium]|nr:glycosyltransferase [Thermodesulfovibrionales bacterium]
MNVSVIVCTYNRSGLLKGALGTLVTQRFPKTEYEIIVIDNNSTDETEHIVTRIMENSPVEIRYMKEPKQGLSHARNTGVSEAKGRIVAFIDDDALADIYWLQEIVTTFEALHPVPGCVGGKISPVWPADRPKWFPESMVGCLSVLDLGESPRWLCENEFVFGTNMAFLKHSVSEAGYFETHLGRKGKSLVSNEEKFLLQRLRSAGKNIYYQPKAVVKHLIPENRLRKRWVLRRFFAQGISDYKIDILNPERCERYSRLSHFNILTSVAGNVVRLLIGGNRARLKNLLSIAWFSGYQYAKVTDRLRALLS